MARIIIICLLFLLPAPNLYSQEVNNKIYQIILKDDSIIESSLCKKEDNMIQYEINGMPAFVSLDLVSEVVEKNQTYINELLKNEVIKCLKSWEPLAVSINEKSIIITVEAYRITKQAYTLMIVAGLSELVYSIPNGWSNIEEIMILNRDRTQGYVFKGGETKLIKLTKIPGNKITSFILRIQIIGAINKI